VDSVAIEVSSASNLANTVGYIVASSVDVSSKVSALASMNTVATRTRVLNTLPVQFTVYSTLPTAVAWRVITPLELKLT
jgi:hypothetical protein